MKASERAAQELEHLEALIADNEQVRRAEEQAIQDERARIRTLQDTNGAISAEIQRLQLGQCEMSRTHEMEERVASGERDAEQVLGAFMPRSYGSFSHSAPVSISDRLPPEDRCGQDTDRSAAAAAGAPGADTGAGKGDARRGTEADIGNRHHTSRARRADAPAE
eukprot:scaffold3319_cov258-Pinguiococcus_pyrenoidosus.AAC.9